MIEEYLNREGHQPRLAAGTPAVPPCTRDAQRGGRPNDKRPGDQIGTLEDGTVVRQAREKAPPRLKTIDAVSLMAKEFEPLKMPVGGLIVEGLTLLCGAPKVGKSWLVLSLCCAVASGRPFLGKSTQAGNVLYLALEDSQMRLKDRLLKLGEAPTDALQFAIEARPLDGGLLDDLKEWVDSVDNPALIVIDTLQKIRGVASARVNAYANDYRELAKLKEFADAHHVAVVCIHHLNKMTNTDDSFNKVSGSTGVTGTADTTIIIERERGCDDAVLSFHGRDMPDDDVKLRMNNGRWQAVSAEAAARESYERDPIVRLCRDLMNEAIAGMFKVSLQGLMDAAADRYGCVIASTKNELGRRLEALAPKLKAYDGIILQTGKRVGSERGVHLVKGGVNDS